jgi:erythromycin esterase-like protein
MAWRQWPVNTTFATDYDPIVAAAGNARVVFLGEQTHGTHEFYRERARITQRLVLERGFRAIAFEADWPEIERVNRYIHGEGSDRSAQESLGGVTDFPLWMWRNTDMRDLVEWLRTHNAALPTQQRVTVYGLDVYSLYPSADAVVAYLETVDSEAAGRARGQYACFAAYRPDPQRYGASATGSQTCEAQAAAVRAELQRRATNMLVGFFTHHGTVMAAPVWGRSGRVFDVRPALPGSYSDVFHAAAQGNFLLMLGDAAVSAALGTSRLERAIGVVYVPASERQSHYFLARLAQQFDAAVSSR